MPTQDRKTAAHLAEAPDLEACTQYRSISGLAVFGLLFGLLSPLALVDPAGWLIPLAAIAVCAAAVWRVRRHADSMIGRKAAVCGLMIAVLSGAAAVSQWFAFRFFVERQARAFAASWFELLAENQPMKAHQLNLIPAERKPLAGNLQAVYGGGPKSKEDLDLFLEKPLVRAILALGKRADVRFYECEGIWGPFGKENVKESFSISFEDKNGKRKTFFASVLLRRFPPDNPAEINWVVADMESGDETPLISEAEGDKQQLGDIDL